MHCPYIQRSLKKAFFEGAEAIWQCRLRSDANYYPAGSTEREVFNEGFRKGATIGDRKGLNQ